MLLAMRANERSPAFVQRVEFVARRAEQLADGHDPVAPGAQVVDDVRQRRDRLRTVAAGVVQQDDAAVATLLLNALENRLRTGQFVILRVDALHDRVR